MHRDFPGSPVAKTPRFCCRGWGFRTKTPTCGAVRCSKTELCMYIGMWVFGKSMNVINSKYPPEMSLRGKGLRTTNFFYREYALCVRQTWAPISVLWLPSCMVLEQWALTSHYNMDILMWASQNYGSLLPWWPPVNQVSWQPWDLNPGHVYGLF